MFKTWNTYENMQYMISQPHDTIQNITFTHTLLTLCFRFLIDDFGENIKIKIAEKLVNVTYKPASGSFG